MFHKKLKKENAEPSGTAISVAVKKKRKAWIIPVVILVLLLAAALIVPRVFSSKQSNSADDYTKATVERRDVTEKLTGSGTLEPADSYTVATLVEGQVLSAGFEEGDLVSKGSVLYQIDSSSISNSIKQAEASVSQNQRSYNKSVNSLSDLTVTAPISGHVTSLAVAQGDSITTQTAIATIVDDSTLKLTQYYSYQDSDKIYAGMPAVISVPGQMLNLNGSVDSIDWITKSSDTGVSCFSVTVSVKNPGSLTAGTSASCSLTASDGSTIYPATNDSSKLANADSATVYAEIQGKVGAVKVKNYGKVTKGQTILTLSSDSLDDSISNASNTLQNSELSLDSQNQKLSDYTVTAPIDGTVVNKYYKEGETVEAGKTLCTIYDLSYLTVTLNVDELDISKVAEGQEVSVTADAASGKTYSGTVTKVGISGTTTNGVTTYPVTIRIDDTDGLRPGMNADVSITVQQSSNVLAIPAEAVKRGNKILVKTVAAADPVAGTPEGYEYKEITVGSSDDTYIEVTSGLSEGDEIAYQVETAPDTVNLSFDGGESNGDSNGSNSPDNSNGTASSTAETGGEGASNATAAH